MAKLPALHHIGLKANGEAEFKKALKFYQTMFDLPLLRTWGQGATSAAMLQLDGLILEIVAGGEDSVPNGYLRHIAFFCHSAAEVDEQASRLAAAGYPTLRGPFSKNLGGDYPMRTVFCQGPLGEEIEFFYPENDC